MGKDKATLRIGNAYMIEYPLNVMKRHFRDIMVITSEKLFPKLKMILNSGAIIQKDIYPKHGALGGIYTALFHSRTPYIFVAACDMPFLNDDFIDYMTSHVNGYDIIIPKGTKGYETLHAIYKKSLLDNILRNIMNDTNKIKELFSEASVYTIPASVVQKHDKNERMFVNINTFQDVERNLL